MTTHDVVVLEEVSFTWPDGTGVLDHLSGTFTGTRTGLVGANGSGKSTLLRLISGDLHPTAGVLTTRGRIGYLTQDRRRDGQTVADALGLTRILAARDAIAAGSTNQHHFDVLEGHWDAPERALAQLAEAGLNLSESDLARPAAGLSGGEWTLTSLLGVLLDRPDILLLDEPTNDLDHQGRQHLYQLLATWSGPLIVVSHDRVLLEQVEAITEIRGHKLRTYGGAYSDYLTALEAEQDTADRAVRVAEEQLRREQRQKAEAQIKLTRRQRYANTDHANKRRPKVIMNELTRRAEVSAGKLANLHEEKIAQAHDQLATAQWRAKREDTVRIELPGTTVPAGKHVLTLQIAGTKLSIRGPERIAVTGRNGSGKTTVLDAITAHRHPNTIITDGPRVPWAYLDQHLSLLEPSLSAVENVRRRAPGRSDNDIRAQLARLLLRGEAACRPTGTLSGGERFRAALATALLAQPAPQLLILDEPTNNLDLATVTQLVDALEDYRGALLIASHDPMLLTDLHAHRAWHLSDPTRPPTDTYRHDEHR